MMVQGTGWLDGQNFRVGVGGPRTSSGHGLAPFSIQVCFAQGGLHSLANFSFKLQDRCQLLQAQESQQERFSSQQTRQKLKH